MAGCVFIHIYGLKIVSTHPKLGVILVVIHGTQYRESYLINYFLSHGDPGFTLNLPALKHLTEVIFGDFVRTCQMRRTAG